MQESMTRMERNILIALDTFVLIVRILKDLKNTGKLSCSTEVNILSNFSILREFWNLDTHEALSTELKNKLYSKISPDVLPDTLDQFLTEQKVRI